LGEASNVFSRVSDFARHSGVSALPAFSGGLQIIALKFSRNKNERPEMKLLMTSHWRALKTSPCRLLCADKLLRSLFAMPTADHQIFPMAALVTLVS
jgi:hypothetical protein